MDQSLINLMLALAANELIHNVLEVQNMRDKLKRLSTYMAGKSYKEIPLNIDTRLKSYGLSFTIFIVVVGALFAFFSWLSLSPDTAVKTVIVLLVLSYAATAVTVDQFHVDIEKITKPFKKKVDSK